MSHKKYSIVCSASAAGWGGNWPFVWIKSILIMLVLRMGHMTEMQLEAHWEAGGPNSSSARVSFLLRKRGRKSRRVCPWTKSSRFQLCPHSENVLLQEWIGVYTMSWMSVCYFNLRRALPDAGLDQWDAAHPPRRARPLDVGSQSRGQKECSV